MKVKPRKQHTSEQIMRKLREAEVELASGPATVDVMRKLEITEQTYSRCARNTAVSVSTRRSA